MDKYKKNGVGLFSSIRNIKSLALILDSSIEQLNYLLYARNRISRYKTFTIKKKRGGERTIKSPRPDLKLLQRKLLDLIQSKINLKSAVHGFTLGKSIVTNAACHVNHRWVLNVDLQDFFPSINYGRVRGLFMGVPFCATPKIATTLAQICCHENSLPQGAPTSPIISNLICYTLDSRMQALAHEHKCIYTRYADDITVSKRKNYFPKQIAEQVDHKSVTLGNELRAAIEGSGFVINPSKVHLINNTHRQIVTGLTVNTKVNVNRIFIREIRAMINDWKHNGLEKAEAKHHASYYRHPDRINNKASLPYIIEGKLNFLKMVRGENDSVRRTLQTKYLDVNPGYLATITKENSMLASRDFFISHAFEDKAFVKPFTDALLKTGVSAWYDEYEITIGDNILDKINDGLINSKFGIVILSPSFFSIKKKMD